MYEKDDDDNWLVHDNSILSQPALASDSLLKLTISTNDQTLDSGGDTLPFKDFKVTIGGSVTWADQNPYELLITVAFSHPCRGAIFESSQLEEMEAIVRTSQVTQSVG